MTAIKFTIESTFDLASRGSLLVPGELQSGTIQTGTILQIEGTTQTIQVQGIELHSFEGTSPETRKVTLILNRKHAQLLQPGTVLVTPT
ncbi:hypothetical protein ACXJJ3_18420 [Kribbella sp. WER1]